MEAVYRGKPKLLLNLSNFRSTNWTEEQKQGWDKIIDIKFPTINWEIDSLENLRKCYIDYRDDKNIGLLGMIKMEMSKYPNHECFLHIVGEQTIQHLLTIEITDNHPDIHFAFQAIWKRKTLGSDVMEYKFIKWRFT